jgi:PilZ domain
VDPLDFLDQRREPRFRTSFVCTVDTPTSAASGVITNLSMSGLQLECDHTLMKALMPNIKRPTPHKPIELTIHFGVPTSRKDKEIIDLHCKIIYSRRLAQDKYVLGCAFGAFEHQSDEMLQDYLEHFGERI